VKGSLVVTLVLLAALLVGGVIRIVIALHHREVAGWRLMLLGGILSLCVAAMLYATLRWSGGNDRFTSESRRQANQISLL
jgi:uncharacterized membrane protein HdeD (DUF308 family)